MGLEECSDDLRSLGRQRGVVGAVAVLLDVADDNSAWERLGGAGADSFSRGAWPGAWAQTWRAGR